MCGRTLEIWSRSVEVEGCPEKAPSRMVGSYRRVHDRQEGLTQLNSCLRSPFRRVVANIFTSKYLWSCLGLADVLVCSVLGPAVISSSMLRVVIILSPKSIGLEVTSCSIFLIMTSVSWISHNRPIVLHR